MTAIIIILCVALIAFVTFMIVLYFLNDRALRDEITALNKKINYYINVLKRKGGHDEF